MQNKNIVKIMERFHKVNEEDIKTFEAKANNRNTIREIPG